MFRPSHLVASLVAFAASALTQTGLAQTVLNDPDFAGLFSIGSATRAVARDSARGWNYLLGGNWMRIDGVSVGKIARISDAGIVDTGWILDMSIDWESIALDRDGNVFAMESGGRWQRLLRRNGGGVSATPLASASELPEQDFVALAWYAALNNANATVRGADGSALRVDLVRPVAPTFTSRATLTRTSSRDSVRWSAPIEGQLFAFATDDAGRFYLFGDALKFNGASGNLLRVLGNGAIDTTWTPPAIEFSSNYSNHLRVVGDRLVVAALRYGPPEAPGGALRVTALSLANGSRIDERCHGARRAKFT